MKRDYYEVLGLSKGCSKDDIKAAYRKLAKQYHPDLNKAPDAAKKFEEIQEAYDVLYDDTKRKTYDQFGMAAFEQGSSTGGAGNPFGQGFSSSGFSEMDLGDLFSSFFGGGGARRGPSGPRKGNDAIYRIKISFMDSIKGTKVNIPVDYDEPCSKCGGTGAKTPSDYVNCPECHGTGRVQIRSQSIFGPMVSEATCSRCRGTGKIVKNACESCRGRGYTRVKKTLEVNIPSSISSGQQVRLKGMGERGFAGGPNGDLYIEVIVQNSDKFTRNGNDIHTEALICFPEAALGAQIDVETVYGTVSMSVPEGTQSGQILKLKGKGVKDRVSGRPGDQFVHVKVVTPTKLSDSEKALYKELLAQSKKDKKGFRKFFGKA